MLQMAQEEQVGVSKEEMEQLMHSLVASLEEKCSSGDVQVDDGQPSDSKVNMGELFRPTVNVENKSDERHGARARGYSGDVRHLQRLPCVCPSGKSPRLLLEGLGFSTRDVNSGVKCDSYR